MSAKDNNYLTIKVLHEIMHAMRFSQTLHENFLDSKGNAMGIHELKNNLHKKIIIEYQEL